MRTAFKYIAGGATATLLLTGGFITLQSRTEHDTPFTRAWSHDEVDFTAPRYDTKRDQIIAQTDDVLSPTRLVALDGPTGKVRWQAIPWNNSLSSVGPVDGTFIPITYHSPNGKLIAVLDPETGKEKWNARLDANFSGISYADNTIVLQSTTSVVGIDHQTGWGRWQMTAPKGCTYQNATADSSLVAVPLECDDTIDLIVLDASDGRQLWTRPFGQTNEFYNATDAVIDGEVVAFFHHPQGVVLYDRAGRTLLERFDTEEEISREIHTHGEQIFLSSFGKNREQTLESVDLRSGRTRWKARTSLRDASIFPADDVLYVAGLLPEPFYGSAVATVSLDDGEITLLPWRRSRPLTIQASRNLIFVSHLKSDEDGGYATEGQISAVRLKQSHNDTMIRQKDWPDTCAILRPEDLRLAHPGTFTSRPDPVRPLGVNASCQHVGDAEMAPVVTVRIHWAARSVAESKAVFSTFPAGTDISGVGDEARFVNEIYSIGKEETTYVRVAHMTASVTIAGAPGRSRALAGAFAERLRKVGSRK